MRFIPNNARRRKVGIDITPLIDVVFLLIIFFMTTAQFVKMTQADLDLPKQAGDEEVTDERSELVINISQDGMYIVDGRSASLETVVRKVAFELAYTRAENERIRIMIRADRRAHTGSLNSLIAELSELGVRNTSIGVEVRP
ncbi:MAG: biopolymer transporter ExbD [Phycisphaerales bacterium]|nr:biopolymer transporter ExbD [Phycisphaerales bacterium]